jgi:hypothetical protein
LKVFIAALKYQLWLFVLIIYPIQVMEVCYRINLS